MCSSVSLNGIICHFVILPFHLVVHWFNDRKWLSAKHVLFIHELIDDCITIQIDVHGNCVHLFEHKLHTNYKRGLRQYTADVLKYP